MSRTLIKYVPKRFAPKSIILIDKANAIIHEYMNKGYMLTLRMLYYQMVSRDIIPNNQKAYKCLGSLISDARRAGLVDWNALEDRTRNLKSWRTFDSPKQLIEAYAETFNIDMWEDQDYYVEVWVEKDAMLSVIERACSPRMLPHFSCRGYVSDSEIWNRAQIMRQAWAGGSGRQPVVIHLGDHDPSGVDMTRDVTERLRMFSHKTPIIVNRVALTMDQINEFNPPPNPAKVTDSRFEAYNDEYGDESWELDALNPEYIGLLIEESVVDLIDEEKWDKAVKLRDAGRAKLLDAANRMT